MEVDLTVKKQHRDEAVAHIAACGFPTVYPESSLGSMHTFCFACGSEEAFGEFIDGAMFPFSAVARLEASTYEPARMIGHVYTGPVPGLHYATPVSLYGTALVESQLHPDGSLVPRPASARQALQYLTTMVELGFHWKATQPPVDNGW